LHFFNNIDKRSVAWKIDEVNSNLLLSERKDRLFFTFPDQS